MNWCLYIHLVTAVDGNIDNCILTILRQNRSCNLTTNVKYILFNILLKIPDDSHFTTSTLRNTCSLDKIIRTSIQLLF